MSRRLAGKAAIVTGAGSIGPGLGNGKAAALLFAREGAQVLACDIDLAAAKGTCIAVQADVSSDADVRALVARYQAAFGRIDVLHNNVGIDRVRGPTDLTEADWDLVMATNLRSLFLICRHVIPVMERQGGGAIVNIGSVSGLRFMGLAQIAYGTSKGAVLSFTRGIAAQYGPSGIRANCVIPGVIHTPVMQVASGAAYTTRYGARSIEAMHAARAATIPLRRFGTGWDVTHASLFLASDEARYVTGAELVVDGGLTTMTPQPAPMQHQGSAPHSP